MSKDQFWYSPYELKPLPQSHGKVLPPHRGFLIRWRSADFEEGYADCLPWEMFGDDSIEIQLKKWRQGAPSSLLQRSLYFAHLDGVARSLQVSLFNEGPEKIKSHYTCADVGLLTPGLLEQVAQKGFTTLKIKVGRSPEQELSAFKKLTQDLKSFRLRLDFNSKGFEPFMGEFSDFELRPQLDFVEDPCEYSFVDWEKIHHQYSLSIYFDQPPCGAAETIVPYPRVIKPARQNLTLGTKDIITNSMDHPVGQSFAFWTAQQELADREQALDFGLQTSHLFEPNSFSQEIESNSCYFQPSRGWGIGFNDHLRKTPWTPL